MKGEYFSMQCNKKLNKNNSGFSLIELIVTVVILALVTAPFLSSFVTASRTNLKAKRIEAANEISQEIIERFKGSDIYYIKNLYGMTVVNDALGNPTDTFSSTIDCNGSVVNGYSGYTAKVDLTGGSTIANVSGSSPVNGSSPVIDEVASNSCAFISSTIFKGDKSAKGNSSVNSRKVDIVISYNDADGKYHANVQVYYVDISGNVKITMPPMDYSIDTVPTIYIAYKKFDKYTTDSINIWNQLTSTQLGGADKKLQIYLVNQNKTEYGELNPDNVKISEDITGLNPTGSDWFSLSQYNHESGYISKDLGRSTLNTNVLTTVNSGVANINNVVRTEDIDYLYELKVEISYGGKVISTYTASKNIVD